MYQQPGTAPQPPAGAPPQQQLMGGFGSPGSLSGYLSQYTSPQSYQQFQAAPGYASLNTGMNIAPPSLPPGALSSLMSYPQANFSAGLGAAGGMSPGQKGSLNNLYNNALLSGNYVSGNALQNMANQARAQGNFQIGQDQGALTQQAGGLAAQNYGFNLDQALQAQNAMRSLFGGMFGNLFSMLGGLGGGTGQGGGGSSGGMFG